MRSTNVRVLALLLALAAPFAPVLAAQERPAERLAAAQEHASDARFFEDPAVVSTRRAPLAADELFEVVDVIDGDTVHVMRNGVKEKLRLLSVDTEEKLSGNAGLSPTKPETLFGEACAQWAKHFFPEYCTVDGKVRVGLMFPDGFEQRDVYGRLLSHVVLPDGVDYQVLLVRMGKSPYFNKYGNSSVYHDAFVAAQRAARAEQLGIWNPATNRPRTPDEPEVRRPYDRLLPWWDARAAAIDAARARHAANPVIDVDAELPAQVQLAAYACEGGATVHVFGSIDRIFEEKDGSRTLLLRTGDKARATRILIPRERLAAFDMEDLRARAEQEFVQNYLVFTGTLEPNPRGGYAMSLDSPDRIRLGGPEPKLAEPVEAGAR
ncbi:MAG: thermonuclease family protein [Planctomycetota bacterium]